MRRALSVALSLALTLPAGLALAQDEAALRDRVGQLVDRLATGEAEARDAAERALIGLGTRALPLLPAELPPAADEDAKARLTRVRNRIEAEQEEAALGAAKVTIQGQGIRLTEALRELQKQSGNRITDLREVTGGEATNPALDLDLVDVPFFVALDTLARMAEFTPEFFTGDGSIGLMPGAPSLPLQVGEAPPDPLRWVQYAGPFRVSFKRIGASRELASGVALANAQFDIAWEPRIRPMLLSLKSDRLEIVDNRGEVVPPDVAEETSSVVLRPENPTIEVNINMQAPDREATMLGSFKVRGEVTAPAGLRRFRFSELRKEGQSATEGEVTVILDGVDVDANVWKVRVGLRMPGEGPVFESYQQGLFNNRIWLEKSDGARFEQNGGFNFLAGEPGVMAFEYLFVDAPGKPEDYALVYETPSRVTTIPLEFEFRDVPLP